MSREEILVVDDEKNIRTSLEGILKDEGYRVRGVPTGEELLKQIAQTVPDLVILDVWLPGMDGLQALTELKRLHPELPVIMISGHGTVETAVKATKLGAYDFIEKPLSLEKTVLAVRNALDRLRLELENRALRQTLEQRRGEPGHPGPARPDPVRGT
jgi:two-component system nitrogen regulation response regulator NtrX